MVAISSGFAALSALGAAIVGGGVTKVCEIVLVKRNMNRFQVERTTFLQETADIRKELREESILLRKSIADVKYENQRLQCEVDQLRDENISLKLENGRLTTRIVDLESRLIKISRFGEDDI